MSDRFQIPIVNHPKLPEGVPLAASFNDDRNRLSYYYPLLRGIEGVRTPLTVFIPVNGSYESCPDIEYRDATRFMQDIGVQSAFVRGDYSSGKFDDESGSKIESQDRYDIESVVLEMLRQLGRSKRHLGGRIAVREWLPHDREVRYFIRDGEIVYRASTDGDGEYPDEPAEKVATEFDTFAWSVDFIRHEKSGSWYCIDMGLDGLYYSDNSWTAISGHYDDEYDPEKLAVAMPKPQRLLYRR